MSCGNEVSRRTRLLPARATGTLGAMARSRTDSKLRDKAAALLLEGETWLTGIRADADWVAGAAMSGAISGAVGGVTGGFATYTFGDPQERRASQIELTARMSLGLTDRRVIIWERSTLFFNVKGVLGSIPLEDITGMRARKYGNADRLTIGLATGPALKLDVPRADDAKGFAKRFQSIG